MKVLKQIIIITLLSAISSCNMNLEESSGNIQINCLSQSRAIINKTITSIELRVTGSNMQDMLIETNNNILQVEVPHGEDRIFSIEIIYSDYSIYQGTSGSVDITENTNSVDIIIDIIPFQTKWKVGTDKTLKIPLWQFGTYDFIIDWGDGTKSNVSGYSDLVNHPEYELGMTETYGTLNHTYQYDGDYIVTITGLCEGFGYSADFTGQKNSSNSYLLDILSWGGVKFSTKDPVNMSTFAFCDGLGAISARDIPDLSNTTSLQNMFMESTIISGLKNWNTTNIKDMSNMFLYAKNFNEDLSNWDTGNVTTMYQMFCNTDSFNGNISTWNVSKVENMSYLFSYAINFNRDLSAWNTSSATDMSRMFEGAGKFNVDLSQWTTGSVFNMNSMFQNAVMFNQDISKWDVFNVMDISNMFNNATSFSCGNIPLSSWNWIFSIEPSAPITQMALVGSAIEGQETSLPWYSGGI